MQTYEERTKDNQYKIDIFRAKQQLPYEAKVQHAKNRAWEFYERMGGNVCVNVGGLDSITLLLFLRHIGIDVPAVSVSSLEDKSIQRIHKQLGVIRLKAALKDDGKPVEEDRYHSRVWISGIVKGDCRKDRHAPAPHPQ